MGWTTQRITTIVLADAHPRDPSLDLSCFRCNVPGPPTFTTISIQHGTSSSSPRSTRCRLGGVGVHSAPCHDSGLCAADSVEQVGVANQSLCRLDEGTRLPHFPPVYGRIHVAVGC